MKLRESARETESEREGSFLLLVVVGS